MLRSIGNLAMLGWTASCVCLAQLPVGYEVVTVADTFLDESRPAMNSSGQIVYVGRVGSDNTTSEIYLYDDRTGETEQLTSNNYWDGLPDINAAGAITWSARLGPNEENHEIMLRLVDGTVLRLTNDNMNDTSSTVNSLNQVAWKRVNGRGCDNAGRDVMFFDGSTIRQITNNDWANQDVGLSDRGDIIWTQFNFCAPGFGWVSRIKLYRDGRILTLNADRLQAQSTSISSDGSWCAWAFVDPDTHEEGVHVWQDGVTTLLTDWGEQPVVNDRGHVGFVRWHENTSSPEAWLYRDAEFRLLTDPPGGRAWRLDINRRSEVCWTSGEVFEANIDFLRRLPLGDLNCDGTVDALDIEGFLLALFDPENFPPDCDPTLADINDDGTVDALDIEPFIALLFP